MPEFSPTRPPAGQVWQELLNAQPAALVDGAVAITLPVANEPMMAEPGELKPARPPSATLTAALLTVTSAFDPVIKPACCRTEIEGSVRADEPAQYRAGTVPPSTEPLAVTLLIAPGLVPASVPTVWNVTPGLAVTSTFVRLRLRTTPVRPMTPNSPTLWVVELFGRDGQVGDGLTLAVEQAGEIRGSA